MLFYIFCSVLQLAMGDWRCDLSHNGLGWTWEMVGHLYWIFALPTTFCCLQDLPRSAEQLGYVLDKLVTSFGKVGLKLNAAKTKALTTQAQPPKTLTTRAGLEMAGLVQWHLDSNFLML